MAYRVLPTTTPPRVRYHFWLATSATGPHPFPSRTRSLSLSAPMVLPLRGGGRVGRRQPSTPKPAPARRGGLRHFHDQPPGISLSPDGPRRTDDSFGVMTRCGNVALAGRPNVGKSTLLNALIGEHLAIVSPKPQSTRLPVVGLLTRGDSQFIFTDSPGLLEPEYPLHHAMRAAALRAIADADLIAYLHPLDEYPAPELQTVARLERPPHAPVVTVYTKADLVPPSRRPSVPPSAGVVVSAAGKEGLAAFLDALGEQLPVRPFHYDPEEMATQPMRFFAAEFVREAAFELLHEELPYSVAVEIDEFREGAIPVYIRAIVYVERDSQKGIVIGEAGRTIKALGQAARAKIEALLGQRVFLDLHVKLLPKWRRHEPSLRRLGYTR